MGLGTALDNLSFSVVDFKSEQRKLPPFLKLKLPYFQGMLIKGGVTLITRGFGQTVTLEPYLFAEVRQLLSAVNYS